MGKTNEETEINRVLLRWDRQKSEKNLTAIREVAGNTIIK